jgi:hypothetical protein
MDCFCASGYFLNIAGVPLAVPFLTQLREPTGALLIALLARCIVNSAPRR